MNNPLARLSYKQALLVASDLGGIALCLYAARWIRYGDKSLTFFLSWDFVGFFATVVFILSLFDLYKRDRNFLALHRYGRLFVAIATLVPAVSLYLFAFPQADIFGRGVVGIFFIGFSLWIFCLRFLIGILLRRQNIPSRWLVLGHSPKFLPVLEEIEEEARHYGIHFSRPENFNEDIRSHKWDGFIICDEPSLSKDVMGAMMNHRLAGKRVYKIGDFYESLWPKVSLSCLEDGWFTFSRGFRLLHDRFALRLKRSTDIALSSILLTATLPFSLLIALAIKIEGRGSVFYVQKRIGINNRLFTIFKFRSMKSDTGKGGAAWTLKSDSRITQVGKFIRLTHLDELPQLINIFKGDMSFIGPRPERPLITQLLEYEIPFYNTRHTVKPGLTGWAQVLYPYGSSVEDARAKLQYDLYYIKNFSFFLDLLIFLKTFRIVLFGKGR